MQKRFLEATAALSCGLAVILGALAAHALHDTLVEAGHDDSWHTAVLYHLTHSIAALVLAQAGLRKCAWTLLSGILFFSGSIYVLCLVDGMSWLGPVTPLGGVLMIIGWFAAAVAWFSAVAPVADALGHHPDLALHGWNTVTVRVTTHAAGGVTLADVALAARLDAVPCDYSPKWLRESGWGGGEKK